MLQLRMLTNHPQTWILKWSPTKSDQFSPGAPSGSILAILAIAIIYGQVIVSSKQNLYILNILILQVVFCHPGIFTGPARHSHHSHPFALNISHATHRFSIWEPWPFTTSSGIAPPRRKKSTKRKEEDRRLAMAWENVLSDDGRWNKGHRYVIRWYILCVYIYIYSIYNIYIYLHLYICTYLYMYITLLYVMS